MRSVQEKLEGPPFPEELAYLWTWFSELSATRRAGGFGGLEAISYAEIEAWQRLRGIALEPWELQAILDVDAVFRTVLAAKPAAEPPKGRDGPDQRQPHAAKPRSKA